MFLTGTDWTPEGENHSDKFRVHHVAWIGLVLMIIHVLLLTNTILYIHPCLLLNLTADYTSSLVKFSTVNPQSIGDLRVRHKLKINKSILYPLRHHVYSHLSSAFTSIFNPLGGMHRLWPFEALSVCIHSPLQTLSFSMLVYTADREKLLSKGVRVLLAG